MTEVFPNRPTTAGDYVAILRRRKWVIIALPILAAASAYLIAQQRSPLYQASAQILVDRSSIVSAITQVSDPSLGDPTRFLTTQAEIARSPVLAQRVAAAANVPGATAGAILAHSSIAPESDADILDVTLTWPNADGAVRLTNTYSRLLTAYKTELDTKRVKAAIGSLQLRINQLRQNSQTTSESYATLLNYETQLRTIGTLLANNTSVLRPAESAAKTQPKPKKSAIIGALLGLVLGVLLALGAEALDRRVRSDDELEGILGLPLIGRVPPPPKRVATAKDLVMLRQPNSVEAESFRRLKTAIDFLTLDNATRTLMITSAVPGEGKSTTAANLAVAYARSGKRVALVDLDLRRPSLHAYFNVVPNGGVVDIVANRQPLDSVLRSVSLEAPPTTAVEQLRLNGAHARNGDLNGHRELALLTAGTGGSVGADPLLRMLDDERLSDVLGELATRFDLVLVDTPPLLAVGDAKALTSRVDGMVLVLHAEIRRPLVQELARELQTVQAPALGFIVTGRRQDDAYVYGAYGSSLYAYGAETKASRRAERV